MGRLENIIMWRIGMERAERMTVICFLKQLYNEEANKAVWVSHIYKLINDDRDVADRVEVLHNVLNFEKGKDTPEAIDDAETQAFHKTQAWCMKHNVKMTYIFTWGTKGAKRYSNIDIADGNVSPIVSEYLHDYWSGLMLLNEYKDDYNDKDVEESQHKKYFYEVDKAVRELMKSSTREDKQ